MGERDKIKERLLIIFAYIGAVVGAGFASGQEIVQFFVVYGLYGFKGIILASILFSLLGGLLLYVAHQEKVSTYQEFLEVLFSNKLAPFIDLSLGIFLFLGISTMLSASGAVFTEHLYLPKSLGIFLAFIIVALFLITGKKGLVFSFNILVPIKLVLILIITFYASFFTVVNQAPDYTILLSSYHPNYWIISSFLYVGYNFALALVILVAYQSLTSKKDGISGGIWGGLVLGILVLFNYLALSKYLPNILDYEVPMLFIAGNISLTTKFLYTTVLWVGILTTALANTYGFAQRFANLTKLNYKLSLIICLILALPLSVLDFSVLVGKIYPLFGILGVVIMIALTYKATKEMNRELYYNIVKYIKSNRRKV